MNKKLLIFSTLFVIIGLFNSFKKGDKQSKNEIILGMVLLEEANSMKMNKVVEELRTKWKFTVDDKESSDETSILNIDNYSVAIVNMPLPIPGDEIEKTATLNYFWKNGNEESQKHKGHIIVSILNAGKSPIRENIIFNKVVSAILNNSTSIGVYIGGRSLLLQKDFYQNNIEDISETNLPIYNLIYFGIRKEENGSSLYTFGLKDFGKKEMEILDSKHDIDELLQMLYNVTSYVLESNVTLKDGETVGMSETQKLKLKLSKGKYLDEQTLKIVY